jgi:hypothetical protein
MQVKKQLEEQTANLKKMHEEARALIQSTRTMTGKLMVGDIQALTACYGPCTPISCLMREQLHARVK